MGDKLIQGFISALFGAMAGVGAVWYLSDAPNEGAAGEKSASEASDSLPAHGVFETLEVKNLKVTDRILVHDAATGEASIELKDGAILAKKRVLSDYLGGCRFVGQRLQITTGDPSVADNAVYGELATNEEGGAYFALLSPQGTHSVNIGFDKQETGFIISQNNHDSAMVAQAILPIPSRSNTGDGTLPTEPLPTDSASNLPNSVPARLPDSAADAPLADFPQTGELPLPAMNPTPTGTLIPAQNPAQSGPASSLAAPGTDPAVLSPSDLSLSENPGNAPF